MEPLRRLMASRTTFLITHDPWLAGQADTVLDITAQHTAQEDVVPLLTGSSGGFPTMGR
jgi:ABC-type multidrug transport system fused ATPase/permease subunit